MKFNEKELSEASSGPADFEGRLNYKRAHKSGYKIKWFKLKANMLFYFSLNEIGQIVNQPEGVIILENYIVNKDTSHDCAFTFSITFQNEHDKRHILSCRSEVQTEQWIEALRQASYQFWRSKLTLLQNELCQKTGRDPLLMYPRNHGFVRDETWKTPSTFKSHIRDFTSTISSSVAAVNIKETNLIDL